MAFFSRQLRPAEKKYSAFDCELLALYLTVRHFRYFLEGRNFTAYTDHKPLTFAFAKISDPWSARQQRHLTAISEYTTCIKHNAGKSNTVADALSRISINAAHQLEPGVDFSAMAAAQQNDPEMAAYRTAITGLVLQDVQFGPSGNTLLCDTSTGHPRPVVPASFRKTVFDVIHGLSHPSIRTTQKLLADGVSKLANGQKSAKLARRPKFKDMSRPHCKHLKCHTGGLITSISTLWVHYLHRRGYTHLLTMVDRFSRWPEAVPLKGTDTETCARALVFHWIARFGIPLNITSDRGSQFCGQQLQSS